MLHSYNEQIILFKIVGCYNCEQVQLLTKQEKEVARNSRNFGRNIAAMCNPFGCNAFLDLIDYLQKMILLILEENWLCQQHINNLNRAGIFRLLSILIIDIINRYSHSFHNLIDKLYILLP